VGTFFDQGLIPESASSGVASLFWRLPVVALLFFFQFEIGPQFPLQICDQRQLKFPKGDNYFSLSEMS
jgi:hypothetical protein